MKPPDRHCDPSRGGASAARRAAATLALFALGAGCAAYDHGEYQVLVDAARPRDDLATPDAFDARADAARPDAELPDVADDPIATHDAAPLDGDATPAACNAVHVPDYCVHVPMLPAAPVIDGVLDCGLQLQAVPSAPFADALHVSAEFAAAWRPDGLYVYVVVHEATRYPVADATPTDSYYCGDAVELFVDTTGRFPAAGGYNTPGTAQLIVPAPSSDTAVSTRVSRRTATSGAASVGQGVSSSTLGAYPRAGGYVLEAFVTAAEVGVPAWSLASGAVFGLDVAVDFGSPVADGGYSCGGGVDYDGQLVWHLEAEPCGPAQCHPSNNGLAFCTPSADPP